LTLMPVFARDILHGGSESLGFLMAASAPAPRRRAGVEPPAAQMVAVYPGQSAARSSALPDHVFANRRFCVVAGPAHACPDSDDAQGISTNTLIQTLADDAMRGA